MLHFSYYKRKTVHNCFHTVFTYGLCLSNVLNFECNVMQMMQKINILYDICTVISRISIQSLTKKHYHFGLTYETSVVMNTGLKHLHLLLINISNHFLYVQTNVAMKRQSVMFSHKWKMFSYDYGLFPPKVLLFRHTGSGNEYICS